MAMSARKAAHIEAQVELANDFIELLTRADNLSAQYFAEGYNAGGAEDVTAQELESYNATIRHMEQARITSLITQISTISTAASTSVRQEILKAATDLGG